MSRRDDWKARSPVRMALAVLVGFGITLLGTVQVIAALLTGEVDWPGRGHFHPTWITDRPWFIAALVIWLLMAVIMGALTIRGCWRYRWLVRHGKSPDR